MLLQQILGTKASTVQNYSTIKIQLLGSTFDT